MISNLSLRIVVNSREGNKYVVVAPLHSLSNINTSDYFYPSTLHNEGWYK